MINKYTNKQRGLLAVIMAMVMVFAGAAFVAAEVDATDDYDDVEYTNKYSVTGDQFTQELANITKSLAEGEKAGKYLFKVTGTVEWYTGHGEFTPFLPSEIIDENTLIVIEGIGDNPKFVATGKGVEPVGIDEGKVVFKNLTVDDKSVYEYQNGEQAWEFTYLEFRGNTEFYNVVFDDGIMVEGNSSKFVSCTFTGKNNDTSSASDVDMFGVWVTAHDTDKNIVTFDDCTFKGIKGLKVHNRYTDGNYEVTVDRCIFGTTHQTGIELGNVNTDDSLTVMNSKFIDCNPGFSDELQDAKYNKIDVIIPQVCCKAYNPTLDGEIIFENLIVGSDELEIDVVGEITNEVGRNTVLIANSIIKSLDTTVLEGSELRITTTGNNTVSGTVKLGTENDASTVTLSDFKGTFSVSKGSVKILGDIDSGIVTLDGEAIMVGDVTIAADAELIITKDSTLSIPAGTVLTNNGTITNNGEITINGNISINGTFNNSGGTVIATPGIDTSKITDGEVKLSGDSFGMSQDLESDYTVKTNAFLEKNLTIPKGVTLTIEGNLNLRGCTLFIEGSLVVEKKGVIETSIRGGEIYLSETGTVSNNGIIGNTTGVTISAEYGKVNMKGITGVEFSLTKVKDAGYYLTVSGEAAIKVKESNLLSITEAYIADGFIVKDVQATIAGTILKDATVTIGSKAVVTANIAEMQNGSTLVVNGVISGTVDMVNGAEVIINGESGATYTAKTGDFKTYGDDNKKQTAEDVYANEVNGSRTVIESSVETDGLKGITISVTTKSYTDKDANKTPRTEQKLLVSGIAAVADDKDKNAKATFEVTGKAYIAEGSELVIPDEVIIVADKIITEGLLKVINPTDDSVDDSDDDVVFVGTKYTITVTDETTYDETVTDYYTTFDAAYAAIADADEKTIAISGGYEFTKDYVIAAGQTIEAAAGEFTITKDGTITIQDEGALELPELVVKGILTVIYGADCSIPAGQLSYEVMSKNTETGDITYSGAELAIENAVAGDVIDIVNLVTFKDPVTIAEGVTVNVKKGASIDAKKGLTVAGKLVNEGTVGIADKYDLIVAGEIENEGTITLETESEMIVTGTVVSDGEITTGTINAANYTDEDNNIVYTTVASAVATGENVTVSGKFTENADVVLAEEQTLTINGEVVLKSIRLVAGSYLTVTAVGMLTADVVAAVGTEETTGALSDAVVDVVKITGITNWTVNYNEAKATYTMVMPAYTSGDVVIEAGSVNYTDDNASFCNINANNANADPVYKTMKVASGATIVVANDITDTEGDKKYFVNEGTIVVSDDMNFTNVLLGGTVNVDLGKTLTLTSSQIVGEVVLATKEGKDPASVTISGQVLIGSTPETLGAAGSLVGKIDATAGYVIVFEGSTFQDTTENSTIKSTAYIINDIAFATVFGNENIKIIDDYVLALDDLQTKEGTNNIDIKWVSGDDKDAGSKAIGTYDIVSTTIEYAVVDVIVSAGPGLIIYIDDVVPTLTNGIGKFDIGTHTVTVYLQKGYEGTPSITFNGQTITDGKLVLTSDMLDKENKLVVTGATVMQDQPVVIQPSDSEKDGMELTDILLIVLVVLIVIMAIIVALRMMRS